jgi:deoxyribodipyrimidine photo-lyase
MDAGRAGRARALETFAGRARRYGEERNLPAREGTSRLSPHLHFGEISPATVWHAVGGAGGSVDVFLSELGWRDYAQNLILQAPDYGTRNGRAAFDAMAWREAPAELAAWQQGRTGYPIVDAGMRQLWHTGWMHNRVRMIAASFLVKHLLIDWRAGEQWFWDTLVDADYGANATNWQWVAGSGLDANMFVRIMAPLVQSPKFDAGLYPAMGARTGAPARWGDPRSIGACPSAWLSGTDRRTCRCPRPRAGGPCGDEGG